MPALSIIIPTCGRPSLARTLQSIQTGGISKEDEVLVLGDGPQPGAQRIAESFSSQMKIVYTETERDGHWGHFQRNAGMRLAKGTHLLFIDDDDAYLRLALLNARAVAKSKPEKISIFQAILPPRDGSRIIWESREVKLGNVDTSMFLVPRIPDILGQWPLRSGGDFFFITETLKLRGETQENVVWIECPIAQKFTEDVPRERGLKTVFAVSGENFHAVAIRLFNAPEKAEHLRVLNEQAREPFFSGERLLVSA